MMFQSMSIIRIRICIAFALRSKIWSISTIKSNIYVEMIERQMMNDIFVNNLINTMFRWMSIARIRVLHRIRIAIKNLICFDNMITSILILKKNNICDEKNKRWVRNNRTNSTNDVKEIIKRNNSTSSRKWKSKSNKWTKLDTSRKNKSDKWSISSFSYVNCDKDQ